MKLAALSASSGRPSWARIVVSRRTAARNGVTPLPEAGVSEGSLGGEIGSEKVGYRAVVWQLCNLPTTGSGELDLAGLGVRYRIPPA
jgi:hypothetical protein